MFPVAFVALVSICTDHGPLTRYVKLRDAHAPGTFSPPPWVSDPDMQHGTCVTHVPWHMPGSLTCGWLWSRWRGKRPRHSRRMRNPQFCASGKRPMLWPVLLQRSEAKPILWYCDSISSQQWYTHLASSLRTDLFKGAVYWPTEYDEWWVFPHFSRRMYNLRHVDPLHWL